MTCPGLQANEILCRIVFCLCQGKLSNMVSNRLPSVAMRQRRRAKWGAGERTTESEGSSRPEENTGTGLKRVQQARNLPCLALRHEVLGECYSDFSQRNDLESPEQIGDSIFSTC